MSKPAVRSYSRYAREAAELFGHLLHDTRVEKGLTIAAIAERAGISRGLVHRIEQGDMGCSLDAVFEVASILGVPLFDVEPATLARHLSLARDKLKLLPQAVRQRRHAAELVGHLYCRRAALPAGCRSGGGPDRPPDRDPARCLAASHGGGKSERGG